MDATLSQLLESIELTPAGSLQPLSGGDIAAVYRLETRQGQVVIKHDDAARLHGEAEGLRALRGACSPLVVPEVLGLAEGWLIIESLDTVPVGQKSEAALGEGLRSLHSVVGDAHGWHQDNACGQTPSRMRHLMTGERFSVSVACFLCVRRATSVVYWTHHYAGVSSAWLRIWSAGYLMHRPACSTVTSGREICSSPQRGQRLSIQRCIATTQRWM
ncbi:hypothetical protein HORIV_18410 [Vreelandella olivaria]|uniref:Aminoglycoside phosphotransferase domain-containing protein n=1 Tax=Vreelandella olivaria TaxID=390919 RepID=A0ABM7GFD9_9GAMM|nr:hypothetical protein HORIV_18410 [Halomonas olivaria]